METAMPWRDLTVESNRREFVSLAMNEGANISQLCQRFSISRKTGYKWLALVRNLGSGLYTLDTLDTRRSKL
jgi:transposase-like protein